MTVLHNGLAIPLAVALHRSLKSRNLLRTIFAAPAVLSSMVACFLWGYIMSTTDHGLLNQLLALFGFGQVNWLGNPKLALYPASLRTRAGRKPLLVLPNFLHKLRPPFLPLAPKLSLLDLRFPS
ncbi:sugar ABC transporter permease [Paenibacillus sp. MWE-103]|uniref:Sugar ABC transporter permease n=1 Tax=Paenibacillus artemisiicola TaxID=1172618 RepID=A0ABS3WFB2_9BACL|nr:sugar ABC transporter permease [Paenibacillus artemisiicola]MBO7747002.1 sugar ABC transporter permease [Paenibacillus artemisiicola]